MTERPEIEANGKSGLEQGQARKPYATPTLRRLGSVRELTLSGGGCVKEGKGRMMM
jgi:hypothetical protein